MERSEDMSELTSRLRRMLSQTQAFAEDAPMEALARAKLLVHEAHASVALASENERDEVLGILQLARKRVSRYEAKVAAFQQANAERAALFQRNEQQRYAEAVSGIPGKGLSV
jgi:hypothetical protein